MGMEFTDDPEGLASLAKKMSAAYKAVGYIEKTGEVKFGNTHYKYAEEKDIVQKVRDALSEQGVFIFQSQSASEVRGNVTTTHHECLFVCADTAGWVKCKWQGTGQDSGDKGIYKAQTGANKYVLMKNLLIPTGDDPERDHAEQLRREQEAREQAEEDRAQQAEKLAAQRRRFFALVSKVDDSDGFRDYAKRAAKALCDVASFNDIPLKSMRAACDKLDSASPQKPDDGSLSDRRELVDNWATRAGMDIYEGGDG